MNKQEKKARIRQWQQTNRTELLAAMPIAPRDLCLLLDHLEANLKGCDHSRKVTEFFLDQARLDKERILPWLDDQGGFCDCEVLYNVGDLADSFRPQPIRLVPPNSRKAERIARDLDLIPGWNFRALPEPWRIGNLYEPEKPLRIQMGKKADCTLTLIQKALPKGDPASDDYWAKLWYQRTRLPEKSPLLVSRGALDLPEPLESVLVQTPDWTPVYAWVLPSETGWYLAIQTELRRLSGDLPQLAKLIALITSKEKTL